MANQTEISQKKSYAKQYLRKNFSEEKFKQNILSLFDK